MRILFTGASSFTGYWFARALVQAGHEVTATFTADSVERYSGVRRRRIDALPATIERAWGVSFGNEAMMALVKGNRWDLLCHHGAVVGAGYKSGAFDCEAALHANTFNAAAVLTTLRESGCCRVLLTGSYFEADEGAGSDLEAVSPYGLSKTLTWEVFRFRCHEQKIALGKFAIPNPFGPFEEGRFTSYLAKSWLTGVEPVLKTPDYVRDYVPVDFLAKSYAHATAEVGGMEFGVRRFNPSGWVESNLVFAQRLSANLAPLLGVPCPVRSEAQADFNEPRERRNTQPLSASDLDWNEAAFWKDSATYYQTEFNVNREPKHA